jgi:UDP-N-acetylglucosamine acyltransferase
MSQRIHPSAHVDPGAVLGDGVEIGPHAFVGPGVALGDRTAVGAAAHLEGPTVLGRDNRVFPHACVGTEPQDLKFRGEETRLEVGDRNQFRELTTIHRGTAKGGGVTRIGDDNLFMVYSHVAHDCVVGSRTVFANGATLAGHVEVGDDASISAYSAVHQFCRVGRHAYVGGYTVLTQDALPFVKTVGHKPACYGLNRIGLERKGYSAERIAALESAVRLLIRSKLPLAAALERIRGEHDGQEDVADLVAFVESSQRGVVRTGPGRKGARGAG